MTGRHAVEESFHRTAVVCILNGVLPTNIGVSRAALNFNPTPPVQTVNDDFSNTVPPYSNFETACEKTFVAQVFPDFSQRRKITQTLKQPHRTD